MLDMDERLRELAHARYSQKAFLSALFELALEEQWFDVQHMVQHDMAKRLPQSRFVLPVLGRGD